MGRSGGSKRYSGSRMLRTCCQVDEGLKDRQEWRRKSRLNQVGGTPPTLFLYPLSAPTLICPSCMNSFFPSPFAWAATPTVPALGVLGPPTSDPGAAKAWQPPFTWGKVWAFLLREVCSMKLRRMEDKLAHRRQHKNYKTFAKGLFSECKFFDVIII